MEKSFLVFQLAYGFDQIQTSPISRTLKIGGSAVAMFRHADIIR